VVFKIDKRERLVMDFFDAGTRFRQDIAPLSDLDPELVSYSAEEDGVVLKCREDKAQCISKEIFKLDVLRTTSRVTIPRPEDDLEGVKAISFLQELTHTRQGSMVHVPAETPGTTSRKKAP
jgi:hypothetical protein